MMTINLKLDGALNPVNEFYYNQLMEMHGGAIIERF